MLRFFVFLLFLGVAGGAFYAGMRYQQGRLFPSLLPKPSAVAQPSPAAQPADSAAAFEQKRAAVDSDPKKWLADNVKEGTKPTDSTDSEFLYLYGRALMLTGNHREAMQAFELAVNNLRTEPSDLGRGALPKTSLPLGAEARLAEAAAALKVKKQSPAGTSQEILMAEQRAARILDDLLNVKTEGTPP